MHMERTDICCQKISSLLSFDWRILLSERYYLPMMIVIWGRLSTEYTSMYH